MAAPLAIAPTVNPAPSTVVSLRTVSVVMMAVAARSAPSRSTALASTSAGIPVSTGATGNGMPMSPVWHTRTSSARTPRPSPTSAHMRCAAAIPGAPVAALAFPLESTTAAA